MSSNPFLPAQSDYKANVFGPGRSHVNVGGTVRPLQYPAVFPATAISEQPGTSSDLPAAALISVVGKAETA